MQTNTRTERSCLNFQIVTHLVVGGNDLQVWEQPLERMLLQLGANVLRDEVNGHDVVATLPGDDDVSVTVT
jgi:hypothetical protein